MMGVNSYGYHEGYGTDIRVLTLTTDYFMSVDRKALKTAVWEGTKNQLFFSYMIACTMFPSSLSAEINRIHCCGGGIMNHTSLP